MATPKSWIKAARPRTLPLALSGIIMGCGLAWFYNAIDTIVSILAIITATLIQVFSNFANDYGDSQRGTDNQFRLGPTRTMQSGEISKKEMETGMLDFHRRSRSPRRLPHSVARLPIRSPLRSL